MSDFIEKHFEIDWDNTIDVCQRLKPTEFGYRSVHYIVKFKPDVFPTEEIDVAIPKKVFGLKAEIQVRTILEHGWADIHHEMCYKRSFSVPEKWRRELAGLAAMLEDADRSFSRIQAGLQTYATSYGAYMTAQQLRDEIDKLEIVLEYDQQNAQLASCIGKLAIELEDWQKAIDVLSKYKDSGYQPILRDLGVAMCKQHKKDPGSPAYQQGQGYLEAASAPPNKDPDALASLSGTWKGIDEDKVRELYRQAYELDPSDPYPLGNYLECEIAYQGNTALVPLMGPVIRAAIQRCRDQADVGVNLPWAFYDMGKFYLLLGQPYESFAAYAKAVQLSTASFMIGTSLRSLDKLAVVRDSLPGYEWVRRLLLVGWATKFPSTEATEQVKPLASTGHDPIQAPVVIVAGGTDVSVEQQMQTYRQFLLEAFQDFNGTIISGGTTAGISGLVGDVRQTYPDTIRTIGYVPERLPTGVTIDEEPQRYSQIRATVGDDFSVLESLQYWIDLIASGVSPSEVKLLGINGGAIAAAEFRMALALGARVAVIEDSGRAAARLLSDHDWKSSKMLVCLSPDAIIVRAFIGSGSPKLAPGTRETIAEAINEKYQRVQAGSAQRQEPSMADWDELLDNLKESNRQQADHIFEKLRQIGCAVREVAGRDIALMTFTPEEIELMAEMEHARWVIERLLDGWTRGKKKDVSKKISPYLVAWSHLPGGVKDWDRKTVREIPKFLAQVGLEIHRQS